MYDAYGKTQILNGSGTMLADSGVGNPFMFTGRYNHPGLDLMYFRARMYDMVTGNFISQDPLGFVDGMSLYRAYFVPGGVDPSGRVWRQFKPTPNRVVSMPWSKPAASDAYPLGRGAWGDTYLVQFSIQCSEGEQTGTHKFSPPKLGRNRRGHTSFSRRN